MFERDPQCDYFGATAVENLFLTEYMPKARGDYVKVYLTALYRSARAGEYTMEDMARELDMKASDVEAALRYWERRRLITRISDNPPRYLFHQAVQRALSGQDILAPDDGETGFAEAIYALFGDKRKVKPNEIAQAMEWVEDVGLSREAVMMLLNFLIDTRGVQFSFRAAEKLAVKMAEENAKSAEDAEDFFQQSRRAAEGAKSVLKRMGKRRAPSEDETALYSKWTDEWNFSPDDILAACAETVKGDPNFGYLDGILAGLRRRGGGGAAARLQKEGEERALVKEVASALGKAITPALCEEYEEMRKLLPHSVILLAAREASRGRGDMDAAAQILRAWYQKGVRDEEGAQKERDFFRAANAALYDVYAACGYAGKPTERERRMYQKWREWGFDDGAILLAAEKARGAERKSDYINRVLENERAGVKTTPSRAGAPARGPSKEVAEQRYSQRDYTEDELNALATDLIEEARRLGIS